MQISCTQVIGLNVNGGVLGRVMGGDDTSFGDIGWQSVLLVVFPVKGSREAFIWMFEMVLPRVRSYTQGGG